MRRAIKVLSVLVTVCAMAWAASPIWGACGFSIPMIQGGQTAVPAGFLLTSATDVNGFYWELGNGDPTDGVGADCVTVGAGGFCGYPAFTRPVEGNQWIKGAPAAPVVNYDWISQGTDGCISGGAAAIESTVYGHYIIDSNNEYAVVVVQGSNAGVSVVNLDLAVSGVGPNGNDIPFVPLNGNTPQLSAVSPDTATCVSATVAPAVAGVNVFYDAGGPYAGVLDVSGLSLESNGVPVDCDPNTGCTLTCPAGITRDANLCWVGDTLVVGTQSGGGAGACSNSATACAGDGDCLGFSCQFAPTIVCDPGDPANCFGGGAGACLPDVCAVPPVVTTQMGPGIVGDCIAIGGPTFDDSVFAILKTRKGNRTTLRWDAAQFAVSYFNVIDKKRGIVINDAPIARIGANDGSVSTYIIDFEAKDLRGAKELEVQLVRTDGQTANYSVVD